MQKPSSLTIASVAYVVCFASLVTGCALMAYSAHHRDNDLSTKAKELSIPRPTLVTLFGEDGVAQPTMACEKITRFYDGARWGIDIDTEVGVIHWYGSYLIIDQDKLDAAEAKAKAPSIHQSRPQFPDSNQTSNTSRPELAPEVQ